MRSLSIQKKLTICGTLPAVVTGTAVYLLFAKTSCSDGTVLAILITLMLVSFVAVYAFVSWKVVKPLDLLNSFAREIGIKNIAHRVEMGKKVDCAEIKKCGITDCPAYGKKTVCWVTAGSQKKDPSCPRAMKGEDCRTCDLYDVRDEFGEIGSSLNVMANSFQKLLSEIAGATEKVNESSMEISAAVEEQSAIARTESSSITEISATIEELSASAGQIAQNSDRVAEAAENSVDKTERGSISIDRLTKEIQETLSDIEESRNRILELRKKSEEIGSVMKIINGIADQTKLIAFNASIEASGAGEAGKRFGVVAGEIRRLADGVMESTGKIESKISEIQDFVQSLVISSDKNTEKMEKVSSSSQSMAGMLREIHEEAMTNAKLGRQILTATQQQEIANSQVVIAIREIMRGAEENSSALNQTAKITRDLVSLAKKLEGVVVVQ